jgi:competence protein ComEC
MTGAALAFAAGVLLLQQQAALPHALWLLLLPACGLLAAWRRFLLVPAAFAVGFLWAAGFAHLRLADRLAPELEGRDLEVAGVVASLPATTERGLRFVFDLESAPPGLPRRVLLSWYRGAFAEKRRDRSRARCTGSAGSSPFGCASHGHLNPHGFDYEAWLTSAPSAPPAVRSRGVQRLLGRRDSLPTASGARARPRDRFQRVLGETPSAGILAALAVGEQRAIANEGGAATAPASRI